MSSRLPMGVLTTYNPGDRGSSAAGRCSRVALPGSGPAAADALAAGPSPPSPPPLAAAAVAQGLTQRCCRLCTVCGAARKARKEVSCCTGAACKRRQRRAAAAAAGMLAGGLDRQLEQARDVDLCNGPRHGGSHASAFMNCRGARRAADPKRRNHARCDQAAGQHAEAGGRRVASAAERCSKGGLSGAAGL